MEPKKGFTALNNMSYGLDLIWSTEDGSGLWPDIYPSVTEVWKEIADDAMEQLRQFIDGDREQEDVNWNIAEEYEVVEIEIDENGSITCWGDDGDELWTGEINNWRAERQ